MNKKLNVSDMEIAICVIHARQLITDPANWTTGTNARHKDRWPLPYNSSDASCFCLRGAILKASFDRGHDAEVRQEIVRRSNIIFTELHGVGLVSFNDDVRHSHEQVLAAIDGQIVYYNDTLPGDPHIERLIKELRS